MSVIEALMILYAKEVASCERISAAINRLVSIIYYFKNVKKITFELNWDIYFIIYRITGGSLPKERQNHETALLFWLSHVCAALKRRIDKEIENGAANENVILLYLFTLINLL